MVKSIYLLCIAVSFGWAMKYFKVINPLDFLDQTYTVKLDKHRVLEFKYSDQTKLLRWSISTGIPTLKSPVTDYILLIDDSKFLDLIDLKIDSNQVNSFVFYCKNGVLKPLDNKQSDQGDLLDNLLIAYNYSKSKAVKNLVWLTNGRPLSGEIDSTKFFQIASVAAQSSIKIHTIGLGAHVNSEMLKKMAEISEGHWGLGVKQLDQVLMTRQKSHIMLCTKDHIDCVNLQAGQDNIINIEELNIQNRKVYSNLKIVTSIGAKTFSLTL